MTSPIPSSSVLPITPTTATSGESSGNPANFGPSAAAAGIPAPAASAPIDAAQVARIVAAAQAALTQTVNLSPEAQQAVKMEAFRQLVTNLVNQLQPTQVNMPGNWPAGGVTPQLHTLITTLLQQATASQPLPQQLVSLQSWPSALTQAVLQLAGQGAVPLQSGASPSPGTATPSLPALQNWLVHQGVVQASDGERTFTLTLRVPVAWAQAQSALGAALPGAAGASSGSSLGAGIGMGLGAPTGGLQLPFTGSIQQLASGAMGLVMQPQALPGSPAAAAAQAMRTSALLVLEFQPLAQAMQTAQAASVYMPASMLPQDVQAMLQGKGTDPWLLMVQAQADESGKKQSKNANEHNQNFCNRAGCQYQGRAVCAQPFCAEMNYLWSIDRTHRASRL